MHPYFTSKLFQAALVSLFAAVAAAWWLTVPALMTSTNFVALAGIAAGFLWVLKNTYESAQPASSLAQSLHDVETAAASRRARRSPRDRGVA
jgi:hypothetical protein